MNKYRNESRTLHLESLFQEKESVWLAIEKEISNWWIHIEKIACKATRTRDFANR